MVSVTVPNETFFLGPGQTVLETGEIATAFKCPPRGANEGSQYIKQKIREVMDLAFVGVASSAKTNNGTVSDVKIGLAAVAPTPLRATDAEAIVNGNSLTTELLEQARYSCFSAIKAHFGLTVFGRISSRNGWCLDPTDPFKPQPLVHRANRQVKFSEIPIYRTHENSDVIFILDSFPSTIRRTERIIQ